MDDTPHPNDGKTYLARTFCLTAAAVHVIVGVPIHAEYISMLFSVHAICGSASAPTAQHQRRRPRTAGDRAGNRDHRFVGGSS